MRIIISPAKTMLEKPDETCTVPVFLEDAERIRNHLLSLNDEEFARVMACSKKLTEINRERYQKMDLTKGLTKAVEAYDGIQYKYLDYRSLNGDQKQYLNDHLRILSAFYGVLKPSDGIASYRLEMAARVHIDGGNMYAYWGRRLYDEVSDGSVIINLASGEYARCVEGYASDMINIVFAQDTGGRLVSKGAYAKMARGAMLRWMAVHGIEDEEKIRNFNEMNYCFSSEASSPEEYVFVMKQ